MVIDGKLSLTKLNAKIARLELRAEQYLIHYRCLERHSFEARAERDRLRVMLLHLSCRS